LATHSERLAANFMHFWVARGMQGMGKIYGAMGGDQEKGLAFVKRILLSGPDQARSIIEETQLFPVPELGSTEDWLEFFFPSNPRPVFLFLDDLLTRTSYWWYWFGTWNIQRGDGIHADYTLFADMYEDSGRLRAGRGGIDIDTRTGNATIGNQVVPLQELTLWDGEKSQIRRYNQQSGVVFELSAPTRLGVLMHKDMALSVFNKLYLRQTFAREYFRPVLLNAPSYQLWEVRGDSWKPSS
jgi:hypothetical protein